MMNKGKKNDKNGFWYIQEEKEARQQMERQNLKLQLLKSRMHNIGW